MCEKFERYQEHEFFRVIHKRTKVFVNCLLPTRAIQDLLLLEPDLVSLMRRDKSVVLNIEDYSVLEKSAFGYAIKFLKDNNKLNPNYRPFRLSKVSARFPILKIYPELICIYLYV
jgi:hypothetical protein